MRILWTLAMGTIFVVLLQYQTSGAWSQQQGQPVARPDLVAEDLVSMALSKVVVDESAGVSRDLLMGISRQIARYVVYSAGCGGVGGGAFGNGASGGGYGGGPGVAALEPSTVYVITPTYRRPEQVADLTRLAQTLMLVRDIHWLVVEDSHVKSPHLSVLLQSFGVRYNHLIGKYAPFGPLFFLIIIIIFFVRLFSSFANAQIVGSSIFSFFFQKCRCIKIKNLSNFIEVPTYYRQNIV